MNPHGEIPEFRARYRYFVGAVLISFLILLGRLWQLQIIRGDHYRQASAENFIQEQRVPTVRGVILDRKGRKLADNRSSYDVYVARRFVTDESVERLIRLLAVPPEQASRLRTRIAKIKDGARFSRRVVLRDIGREGMAKLETHKAQLAGVSVVAVPHRTYPHGNLAAHLLGYMNEVSRAELRRDEDEIYSPGDMVGRFGVERMYEAHLRGVPGRERIVVDARGQRKSDEVSAELLRGARRVDPLPGHNLVLTVDLELQRLVERALRRHPSGAAVVIEVGTGRVLASASKPSFDPNTMTARLSRRDARRLLDDPHRPLLDKVFRENYFPGSTYKLIPAIAALESGLIEGDEQVTCSGWHRLGRRSFRCGHAHGKVDLRQAIVESCNVYFYTLAEQVGMDVMARYARLLGLGASTGLGLNGEVPGFIPTKAWYRRRKQAFRIGFTLNAGIGQGNTKVTPVQMASVYAAIASGKLYLPQIVERIETGDGRVVQRFAPRLRRDLDLRPRTLEQIRVALAGVVQERKGTAYEARLEEISVSGKTGTAQVSRRARKGKTIWLADHSWFAAYAPSDRPEIALAVLIEHGGRAAKVAAPVAMEIVRGYFKYLRRGTQRASTPVRGEQADADRVAFGGEARR